MRKSTRVAVIATFAGALGIGGLAALSPAMAAVPGEAPAVTTVVPDNGTADQVRDGSCDGTPDQDQLRDGTGGGTADQVRDGSCDGTPDQDQLRDGTGDGANG